MGLTKTLLAAAALSTFAFSASAGNPTPPMNDDVVMIPSPAPAPPVGSINSGYVVLGLLAALVAASGSF